MSAHDPAFDTRPTRQMPRAELAPVSARRPEDRPTMVICPCCHGDRMITVEHAAALVETCPAIFPSVVPEESDHDP